MQHEAVLLKVVQRSNRETRMCSPTHTGLEQERWGLGVWLPKVVERRCRRHGYQKVSMASVLAMNHRAELIFFQLTVELLLEIREPSENSQTCTPYVATERVHALTVGLSMYSSMCQSSGWGASLVGTPWT